MRRYYRTVVNILVGAVVFGIFMTLVETAYFMLFRERPEGWLQIGIDLVGLWTALVLVFVFNAYRAKTLASRKNK